MKEMWQQRWGVTSHHKTKSVYLFIHLLIKSNLKSLPAGIPADWWSGQRHACRNTEDVDGRPAKRYRWKRGENSVSNYWGRDGEIGTGNEAMKEEECLQIPPRVLNSHLSPAFCQEKGGTWGRTEWCRGWRKERNKEREVGWVDCRQLDI